MANNKVTENAEVDFSSNSSSILLITAIAIGSIITQVAEFEIHIERKADDAIKPIIMDTGVPPKSKVILSAILL